MPREELIERRRQALLVDLFVTGANAVTESGELVNLDMIGNRVGAITFGPRDVVLVVGRNKMVKNVQEGMERIRSCAAPMNAVRHAGWKDTLHQNRILHGLQQPRPHLQYVGDNSKIVPEGPNQNHPDQRGSRFTGGILTQPISR